jgi:hypothetical protein
MSARRLKALIAECEAEDRAVNWLAHLPRQVRVVTAVKAAVELAASWECEAREMLRRRGRPLVYLSTADERSRLSSAATSYGEDPNWQSCPAAQVKHELSALSADAAAFIAYKIAQWAVIRYGSFP